MSLTTDIIAVRLMLGMMVYVVEMQLWLVK